MSATRCMGFVLVSAMFAGAATASVVSCKNGEYDGSYDGSFDASGTAVGGGSSVSRVVQPGSSETVASSDGAFDVTFAPGTFASPAKITVTFVGERTLDMGLIVPIYSVTSDQQPTKFIQVDFHGKDNGGGGSQPPVPAIELGGTFTPLPVVGSASSGGSSGSFWGLNKGLGTFSLERVNSALIRPFSDTLSTCTGQCCAQKGAVVAGLASGCACASGPDLACFLEHCADLEGAAARCTAIAAGGNFGMPPCHPFGGSTGVTGEYPGSCPASGGGNQPSTCCVFKNRGSCLSAPQVCTGFAARCTATSGCAPNQTCCVFAEESYCAKTCPSGSQRACEKSADCNDAGVDAGPDAATCRGGGCPVGVCGALPAGCQ